MTAEYTLDMMSAMGTGITDVLNYNNKDPGKDTIRTWDPALSCNEVPVSKILVGLSIRVCFPSRMRALAAYIYK